MPTRTRWGALSVVLILLWGHAWSAQACPHPCACYVPSEVHCTFRSLASVPAGISQHVERINLGCVFKLSYNKVRGITRHTFQGLSSLVRLHVDHNRIEFLHPQALHGLTSLRLVHLEGNLLHQLHAGTFSTFSFLGFFRLSTVRHLYLADNRMRSLPTGMLQNMPLLENVYLQGNPWDCGCDMQWLLSWEARSRGVLKCKKDKAYEDGQLCATCSSPKKLHKQEIHKLQDIVCAKPLIESPLRQNESRSSDEDQEPEDEESDGQFSPDSFQLSTWNVSLNMTDEHGNTVNLSCTIKKPTDVHKIFLNQTEPLEIEVNATVALDFECPMTRENYEKLWKLIAYYSEVPLKLHREPQLSRDPQVHYDYRQDTDDDALYYTGVKARLLADPEWVMQPSVDIQLNRRQSTAKKVLLSYYAQFSQTVSTKDAGQAQSRSWVMIESSRTVQRTQVVLKGTSFQLSCNVRASESPSIFWVLPDGSVLKAPMEDLESQFSILSGGQLRVKSAGYLHSGVYQCIALVTDDMDRMVYRVTVQVPVTQPPDRHTVTINKNPGEPVVLPCSALAIPEAQLSWVLPNKKIMNHLANTSHTYLLDNETLYIPKVQASDDGYYTCVAVNLQGADHLTVRVTVNKKGPSRASKRGRLPGTRPVSRFRGNVVEDEGGSGVGSEDRTPRRILHPMDQEVFLKTEDEAGVGGQKLKKGRRKWKVWNKEPETNIAEGRRVFESRRRINMTNKQINPQRWADILARVRGRNLSKGTEVPQVTQTTTPPSVTVEVTPLSPAAPPPLVSPAQMATGAEGSSEDMSMFSEEEQFLSTPSSTGIALERDHDVVILAEPKVAGMRLEDVIDHEVFQKMEDSAPTQSDPSVPTLMALPDESSSPLHTLDTFYEEPTHEEVATEGWSTAPSVEPVPLPTSKVDELPLEAVPLVESETKAYLYTESEIDSLPAEDTRFTPTPTWWAVDLSISEPGVAPDVAAQTHLQGHAGNTHPVIGSLATQGNSLMEKDMVEKSQIPESDMQEKERTDSRRPKSEELKGIGSVVPFKPSGETTPDTLFDRDTITASKMTPTLKATSPTMPTTHLSRRKPNGRRLRPHRLRHRQKQTPPTTSAPIETYSTQPTPVAEMKVPTKVEDLVLTPGVDNTVGVPKELEMGKPAEPVTKGTPRRKHSKKQNKHRSFTSTVSSKNSVSTSSSPPENKQKYVIGPSSETPLLSSTIPLKMGDPHETKREEDYVTSTSKVYLPLGNVQETIAVTYKPDVEEIKKDYNVTNVHDYKTSTPVPTEAGTNVILSSGLAVSTVEVFMGEFYPSEFPRAPSLTSPRTVQPQKMVTSKPITSVQETRTDPPLWKELANSSFPSEFSSSVAVSTLFQRGDVDTSATPSSVRVVEPSSQADTTTHGQGQQKPTPASLHPEVRPRDHAAMLGPLKETTSLFPPTTLVSSLPITTKSTFLTPRTSQTPTESKENVLFNYVGVLETKLPRMNKEETQYVLNRNEASTPSSRQDNMNLSPKHELVKDTFDGKTPNTLLQGPDIHHHGGRVQISHQPGVIPTKPTPPRGTVRPPHLATQSSFRYSVTFPPPRHMTSKPEITAYPSRAFPESKPFVTPKSATTIPAPLHRPKPGIPSKFGDHRTNQFNASPKVFGNNNILEQRSPVGKPPNPRFPPHPNIRFPFFFNRTFAFPQLGATLKPQTPTPPVLVTRDRKLHRALMTPNTRTQRLEVLKNGTLVIRKVQLQDHGQYLCTARNLHGAETMPVLLSVSTQQPQTLASHYQDVTVYLGDTIAMECLAKGTPAPQISWIFPDRRVWHTVSPVEGRITLHENRTLSIKEATFLDRGVYQCVASNAAGADSLAIRLHVAALPPVIHQEKQENISLPPGLSIHIHCTAKAAPLPSLRWVLGDGTQVRPSQFVRGNLFVFPNGTLYIRHLAPKDSGRYECVAANLVGSARRTVQLTVQRAAANARITGTSPRTTDVRYGGTLRLDCSASGDPWPRTQWRLPSQRVIDALFSFDPRMKVFANGTLVVKSVTDKDAGDYLCIARNKIGDDYVLLKVNVVIKPATIEHKEGQDHRVLYGGDLKVDCVASGLPNPEISWSLPDGSLVNPYMQADDSGGRAKRYVVFNNGTLYFNEVGMGEEGDYMCFAENQVGKDEMRVRVKVVAEPAAIRNKTYSVVQVPYGDVVTVTCEAKGEPTPSVTWLSPTNRLIPASLDKYQVYHDGTLLIRKAQRSDSGNYTCVVRNSAREDRKVVWVQVHVQPPKINGHPDAITTVREIVAEGSRKLIDCQTEGIPAPRALWAFPEGVVLPAPYYGNRITVHRNGTLDIRSLRHSDSVQFTCIARNEGGEARLIVQLTVLDPVEKPVFHDPVSEKITATAGHTISLNCSASGTPAPTLLWVLPNGTELHSNRRLHRFYHKSDGRLYISGLASGDAGAYRCVARNAAGYSERLVALKVSLKPAVGSQHRPVVTTIDGETLYLPCLLQAGRPGQFSWTLPNGVVLEVPQEVGRFALLQNGTLRVREASVFDRGTYTCKVDTELGPSTVSTPVIVIAYPPRITSEATPVIYIRPGGTVKLNCLAMGIPKARITWELPDKAQLAAGGQARVYGNKFLQPQGSLTIQYASPRDAGFYKCTAENVLGRDSKTTYIHVF
ncbi:matrix-remodeling-associated protein 5 [Orycteropus afer afer]|uniref:Matrix-remodeling-associated protein 5 n=1 Tax=Orycteropus afer afer TaxID=1230840 RepID=A0A8B7B280_ORYAF|nr:matrix-remodeling-associated protein 5 [Orycteropus afer afer]